MQSHMAEAVGVPESDRLEAVVFPILPKETGSLFVRGWGPMKHLIYFLCRTYIVAKTHNLDASVFALWDVCW